MWKTPDEPANGGLTSTGSIIPENYAHQHGVWHYTDAAGIAGLLAGKPDGAGCLRATAITTINDHDE